MSYPVGAGQDYRKFETSEYTLLGGFVPEDCGGTPPVGCYLAITGSSHTDVTVRGEDDGTITIGTTGGSGTMTWMLNGVIIFNGDSLSAHTFTGLTAGVYDVTIIDANECTASLHGINVLDGEFRTGDFSVQQPVVLTAVDNPIIIRVGTAVANPVALQNITTLSVTGGTISDGQSIVFNLTSPYIYTQTFYAKGYPNKPNYFLASVLKNQVGTPVGNNSNTEIATSLADALNTDAIIPKIYYINNDGTTVTLTAKEKGSKLLLDNTNVISAAGILVKNIQVPVDAYDGQITDNYSIALEVMANTDTTNQYPETGEVTDYNRIAELILPFSQDNKHLFDISSILKSQVNTPIPDIALTGSTLLPSVMQPYFTKVSELYPLVPNTNTIKKRYKTNTTVQWVINSSLDRFAQNDMQVYLGQDASNVHGDFGLTFVGTNPYDVTWTDYLISTGATGTTGIQISIWDSGNTVNVKPWQNPPTITGLASGNYYARISGTSDGHYVEYAKTFYVSSGGSGYDSNPVAHFKVDVNFLTTSPSPKQIQRASNEFLYFILPKNYGKTLKVKGDLYFYDGSSETGQTFFTIATGTTNAGGCMVMNLSYDKLGLQNYEVSGSTNRKIKRAEIAVWQEDSINGDWQYTETKVYRFEIDEMPRKAGILFQNSLGMYDAFDFIGVVDETISRDSDTYTVPIVYNADGSIQNGTKNVATYNTKVTKKVIVNSGWIDETHFDWLIDLMKSNNIYSTSTVNQNYLNLVEFTYKKSSLDDLFDIEATFNWTIFENNSTV